MTDRELMQQALDLLDDINQCSLPPTGIPLPAEIDHVMEALRNRLEKWTPEDTAYRPGGLSQSEQMINGLTEAETDATMSVLYDDAIEALRARLANEFNPDWDTMAVMVEEQQRMAKRIEELEAALAQPAQQEPVAWMVVSAEGKIEEVSHYKPAAERWLKYVATRRLVPLYTAPKIFCGCGDQIMPDDGAECGNCVTARNAVKREWQGLTEDEIKHLWYEACQTNLELTSQLIVHLARNIEAKLKEKNEKL